MFSTRKLLLHIFTRVRVTISTWRLNFGSRHWKSIQSISIRKSTLLFLSGKQLRLMMRSSKRFWSQFLRISIRVRVCRALLRLLSGRSPMAYQFLSSLMMSKSKMLLHLIHLRTYAARMLVSMQKTSLMKSAFTKICSSKTKKFSLNTNSHTKAKKTKSISSR